MAQRSLSVFFLAAFFLAACRKDQPVIGDFEAAPSDSLLRMNQIQIIASHNSYRIRTTDTVFSFLLSVQSLLPSEYSPVELDYSHLTFDAQMSQYGIRGLELDIYNDPAGNAFSDRFINSFVGLPLSSGIPELNSPGMKLLHIKDVDYNSHFPTFKQALLSIKKWSESHPGHLPLFVNVETKSDSPGDNPILALQGFSSAPEWDPAAAEALEQEVVDIFGTSFNGLFTPDMLRGNHFNLQDAALLHKWPDLDEVRGKVVLIMEGKAVPFYKMGHPSLLGRAMFVYDEPGSPETAFVLLNDARADSARIKSLVRQGYIVRTRCDAGTHEARDGDYSGLNAAFASGAQILSTDYYCPDPRAGQDGWSFYKVQFPGGFVARKNPVNATYPGTPEFISD